MPDNLEILLIPRAGDKEVVRDYFLTYMNMDKTELIERYNGAWKLGIVGSHHQGLQYYAMHQAFLRVFGRSPITLEGGCLLGLTNPICIDGDSWVYAGENGKE